MAVKGDHRRVVRLKQADKFSPCDKILQEKAMQIAIVKRKQ